MNWEQKEVLVAVTKQLLEERVAGYNHYYKKCIHHARQGNIFFLKQNLKKLGIDPARIDYVLPLIHG